MIDGNSDDVDLPQNLWWQWEVLLAGGGSRDVELYRPPLRWWSYHLQVRNMEQLRSPLSKIPKLKLADDPSASWFIDCLVILWVEETIKNIYFHLKSSPDSFITPQPQETRQKVWKMLQRSTPYWSTRAWRLASFSSPPHSTALILSSSSYRVLYCIPRSWRTRNNRQGLLALGYI